MVEINNIKKNNHLIQLKNLETDIRTLESIDKDILKTLWESKKGAAQEIWNAYHQKTANLPLLKRFFAWMVQGFAIERTFKRISHMPLRSYLHIQDSSIKFKCEKPQKHEAALSTLEKIDALLESKLKGCSTPSQTWDELKILAKEIHSHYVEHTKKFSTIRRFLEKTSQKEKAVEAIYKRIRQRLSPQQQAKNWEGHEIPWDKACEFEEIPL